MKGGISAGHALENPSRPPNPVEGEAASPKNGLKAEQQSPVGTEQPRGGRAARRVRHSDPLLSPAATAGLISVLSPLIFDDDDCGYLNRGKAARCCAGHPLRAPPAARCGAPRTPAPRGGRGRVRGSEGDRGVIDRSPRRGQEGTQR